MVVFTNRIAPALPHTKRTQVLFERLSRGRGAKEFGAPITDRHKRLRTKKRTKMPDVYEELLTEEQLQEAERLVKEAPGEIELVDTDNGYGYGSVGDRPSDKSEAFYNRARVLIPELLAEIRRGRRELELWFTDFGCGWQEGSPEKALSDMTIERDKLRLEAQAAYAAMKLMEAVRNELRDERDDLQRQLENLRSK